jgi:hypothetical protein
MEVDLSGFPVILGMGMPFDYEFDESNRLLRTRIWGVVTGEDLRRHLDRVSRDERLQGDLGELVDLGGVERVEVGLKDLEDIVKADREAAVRTRKRMAIVATREVTFGLARQYALLGEAAGTPLDVRVYRGRLPAERWLLEGR